jgi:Trypsin-like peptidase domain
MRVPERLVEVWAAAGADGPGKCGSGWIVGRSGVVSCRHVLEEYLPSKEGNASVSEGAAGQAIIQVRQAARLSPDAWVDCALVWQHPFLDLVLLQITPRPDQSWESPKGLPSRLAEMGELPSQCVAMGFPDAEERPNRLRDTDQPPGRLRPAAMARDPDRLVPFEVDGSVPDSAALWAGFSGSAVFDQWRRLVGLVAKVHPERQSRRLLVVPIEEAASDPNFRKAAAAVELDPAVEDFRAETWRKSVEPESLTTARVPGPVADVADLKVFGVKGSSSYVEYVSRDKDAELGDALARATTGGQRVVLVVGDSAVGKSRSAAEMLHRDHVLHSWRLVVPLSDGGLPRLADADLGNLGWQETVIWLDDLDKHLVRLDLGTLRRILGEDPNVVVVATIRQSQVQGPLNPAWTFLNDDSEVKRVDLTASLSHDELRAASAVISDPALLNALRKGVGLGEWLVGGPELMARLKNGDPTLRAFADTVIAWYRTGLDQPLASKDARRLWADSLSPTLRQRLLSRGPAEQAEYFREARTWACTPVPALKRRLFEQALITKGAEGYVANDYVLDQVVRNLKHPPIPDSVWEHSLRVAASSPEPGRLWEVAAAAQRERAFTHGLTAMQTLADAGDVRALAKTGWLRAELGQLNEAVGIYDEAVARIGEAPWVDLQSMSPYRWSTRAWRSVSWAAWRRPPRSMTRSSPGSKRPLTRPCARKQPKR